MRIIPPVQRDRLAERSRRDALEELAATREESPSERLELTLELSDLSGDLADSAGTPLAESSRPGLDEKARRLVVPLRAAAALR